MHFHILYILLAIVAALNMIEIAFMVVGPDGIPSPIAPFLKPFARNMGLLFSGVGSFCSNGSSAVPIPLASKTKGGVDSARFAVVCLGGDKISFCSEADSEDFMFRCGVEGGGQNLTIREFGTLMDKVTRSLDQCKPVPGKRANNQEQRIQQHDMGHGIELVLDVTQCRGSLALSDDYVLRERDIRRLHTVAVAVSLFVM